MTTPRIEGAGDYEAERTPEDAEHEFAEAGEVQKSPREADGSKAPPDDASAEPPVRQPLDEPGETSVTSIAQPPKGN
jgi:hypothetical protein